MCTAVTAEGNINSQVSASLLLYHSVHLLHGCKQDRTHWGTGARNQYKSRTKYFPGRVSQLIDVTFLIIQNHWIADENIKFPLVFPETL